MRLVFSHEVTEELELSSSLDSDRFTKTSIGMLVLDSESEYASGFVRKILNWEVDKSLFCRRVSVSLGDQEVGIVSLAS